MTGECPQKTSTRSRFCSRWREYAVLGAILFLAAGLRLYRLSDETPWHDELVSYRILDRPSLTAYLGDVRTLDPPMTPVYFTLQYFWTRLAGDSVVAVRMLSILPGIAGIILLYDLTKRMFGPQAARVAAGCFALSCTQIYYAQEIRVYSLTILEVIGSFYAFHRALNGTRFRFWITIHLACNALMVWTHLFAAAVPATQLLYLLLFRRDDKRFLAVWCAVHVALASTLLHWITDINFSKLSGAAGWIKQPGFPQVLHAVFVEYAGFKLGRSLMGVPWTAKAAGAMVFCSLAILAGQVYRQRWGDGERDPGALRASLALAALWFLLPPTFLLVISYAYRPSFVPRYTLYAAPALYILLGASVHWAKSGWARAGLAILLLVSFAFHAFTLERPLRTDWRGMAAVMGKTGTGEIPVLLPSIREYSILRYYYPELGPPRYTKLFSLQDDLLEVLSESKMAWVVVADAFPGFGEYCDGLLLEERIEFQRWRFGGEWPMFLYHVHGSSAKAPVSKPPEGEEDASQ